MNVNLYTFWYTDRMAEMTTTPQKEVQIDLLKSQQAIFPLRFSCLQLPLFLDVSNFYALSSSLIF